MCSRHYHTSSETRTAAQHRDTQLSIRFVTPRSEDGTSHAPQQHFSQEDCHPSASTCSLGPASVGPTTSCLPENADGLSPPHRRRAGQHSTLLPSEYTWPLVSSLPSPHELGQRLSVQTETAAFEQATQQEIEPRREAVARRPDEDGGRYTSASSPIAVRSRSVFDQPIRWLVRKGSHTYEEEEGG